MHIARLHEYSYGCSRGSLLEKCRPPVLLFIGFLARTNTFCKEKS